MSTTRIAPCKEGDRIELIAMPNDPDPIPAGAQGTVAMDPVWVQDSWQVVVTWDGNVKRSLSLCVPPDVFRILPAAKEE